MKPMARADSAGLARLHFRSHETDHAYSTVARIAYQASDVIVSVQASLAVDSEFSSHLKRYSGRKERSLVAKSVDSVPEVRLCPSPMRLFPLFPVFVSMTMGFLLP